MKRKDFIGLNFRDFVLKVKEFGEHTTVCYGGDKPPQFQNLHYSAKSVSEDFPCEIERFIFHKEKDITVYTSRGVIKFWHRVSHEPEIEV